MYARKIKPEEYPRTEELFCIAFEFPMGEKKPEASALLERVQKAPQNRIELNYTERWAAFDDAEQMAAFLSAPPYPVRLDGQTVTMSAVGGVSTLPQYRKCGAMRLCFEKAFRDMYEAGWELSALYPFSQNYYRKYGYEVCGEKIRYEVDLRAIPALQAEGSVRLLEKGNVTEDIIAVYRAFSAAYNLMVERDEIDFKWTEGIDPSRDGRYVYVCYRKDGTPCAVLDFTKERREDSFEMTCGHFWYIGTEGLQEALFLVRSFSNYYRCVSFWLPADLDVCRTLPEWALYPSARRLEYTCMARVIRVDRVLEKAAYKGSGCFILHIRDEWLEENNRSFLVEFASGRANKVTVMSEKDKKMDIQKGTELSGETIPELSLPIQTFSRWILEGCSDEQLSAWSGMTENELELWKRVFYKKKVFLDDAF